MELNEMSEFDPRRLLLLPDSELTEAEIAEKKAISERFFNDLRYRRPHIVDSPLRKLGELSDNQESARVLMRSLASTIEQWRAVVPENSQPAVLACLYGGMQIHVHSLQEVSFHGIKITGIYQGMPCTMLAHQSTVQLLCLLMPITIEEPKRKIGFVIGDQEIEV